MPNADEIKTYFESYFNAYLDTVVNSLPSTSKEPVLYAGREYDVAIYIMPNGAVAAQVFFNSKKRNIAVTEADYSKIKAKIQEKKHKYFFGFWPMKNYSVEDGKSDGEIDAKLDISRMNFFALFNEKVSEITTLANTVQTLYSQKKLPIETLNTISEYLNKLKGPLSKFSDFLIKPDMPEKYLDHEVLLEALDRIPPLAQQSPMPSEEAVKQFVSQFLKTYITVVEHFKSKGTPTTPLYERKPASIDGFILPNSSVWLLFILSSSRSHEIKKADFESLEAVLKNRRFDKYLVFPPGQQFNKEDAVGSAKMAVIEDIQKAKISQTFKVVSKNLKEVVKELESAAQKDTTASDDIKKAIDATAKLNSAFEEMEKQWEELCLEEMKIRNIHHIVMLKEFYVLSQISQEMNVPLEAVKAMPAEEAAAKVPESTGALQPTLQEKKAIGLGSLPADALETHVEAEEAITAQDTKKTEQPTAKQPAASSPTSTTQSTREESKSVFKPDISFASEPSKEATPSSPSSSSLPPLTALQKQAGTASSPIREHAADTKTNSVPAKQEIRSDAAKEKVKEMESPKGHEKEGTKEGLKEKGREKDKEKDIEKSRKEEHVKQSSAQQSTLEKAEIPVEKAVYEKGEAQTSAIPKATAPEEEETLFHTGAVRTAEVSTEIYTPVKNYEPVEIDLREKVVDTGAILSGDTGTASQPVQVSVEAAEVREPSLAAGLITARQLHDINEIKSKVFTLERKYKDFEHRLEFYENSLKRLVEQQDEKARLQDELIKLKTQRISYANVIISLLALLIALLCGIWIILTNYL